VNVGLGLEAEGDASGLQLGLVNVGRQVSGMQLGLVNVAAQSHSFSLGLVNVAREQEGESLGLLTLVGNGVHSAAVFATDVGLLNVAGKLGGRHLYTLYQFGYQPGDQAPIDRPTQIQRGDRRYSFGLGFGWRAPLTPRLYLDTELAGLTIVRSFSEIDDDNGNHSLFSLRFVAAYRLQPHLSIIGGLTYNAAMSFEGGDLDIGSGVLERHDTHGDLSIRYYPGIILGVQI
jgi:hypothetical protein